jgi:hypothetical protein
MRHRFQECGLAGIPSGVDCKSLSACRALWQDGAQHFQSGGLAMRLVAAFACFILLIVLGNVADREKKRAALLFANSHRRNANTVGARMRASSLMFALPLLLGPAWSEETATDRAATAPTITDQTVTFAELEGAAVEVRVVSQRIIRRGDREFPIRFQNDLKITIGPGNKIDGTITPTSHGPRGERQGRTLTFSTTLDKVGELVGYGGGIGAWTFAGDGTLIFLRTYKEGAFRRTIAFTRSAEGLSCTAKESLARENGVGGLALNSALDDVPITIVQSEQISSSCRVARR